MSTVGKTDKDAKEALARVSKLTEVGTDASAGLISGPGRSHDGKVYRLEGPGHSQQAPEMLHPGLKPARRDRKERGCLGRGSSGWQCGGKG